MTKLTPSTAATGLTILSGGAVFAAVLLAPATARPTYVGIWEGLYPASLTGKNVENGTGTSCNICHESMLGGDGWNEYGWKIKGYIDGGDDAATAIANAEPFDSDSDPTASTNLAEITNDAQPGWTEGPNNTIYYNDLSTLPGQSPPAAILGEFDPISTRYCSPAVANSTGSPGHMSIVGSVVVTDDDLELIATDLPTGSNIGYFIMGTGMNTFTPPGSAGPICVAPGIQRYLPPVNNTSQLPGGFTRVVGTSGPVSGMITAASTWNFQAWHRDGMNPSNLTDAVSVTFQ